MAVNPTMGEGINPNKEGWHSMGRALIQASRVDINPSKEINAVK